MKQVRNILPDLIGGKGRRKTRQGNGTLPLFPAEEIVRCAWEHIAGKLLAARTRPLRIYRDRLIVEVPDSSWPRQMRRYESELLARIQHLLGDKVVAELEWHVNPALAVTAAPPAPPAPARIPPAREVDASLATAAQKIRDPELRQLFLRTAERFGR